MSKDLLILERSSSELEFKSEGGAYVLEGIFGELDVKNRNNRIYTAEEYLPQIEALQAKIKASKLLGELDHPQNFDVSLKNVSHVIEEITYDKENKQIKGRIRLLDTDAGRQAKALVDAGVPLQISSRAAGAVESNGQVKIKQLFTYDLVADPGFENAELKRVNESYGFSNDDSIQIFEIESGEANLLETNVIENKEEQKMAESKFISVEDFNKYSQYLAEEIKSLKEAMESAANAEETNEIENVKEYMTYLAEKLDQSISYSEHVAEKTDQAISYSEHVAEKLDQSISYSEHMAEGLNQIKEYTNYLAESYNEGAETHENLLKYVDYLKENLQSVTEYAEYVAETVNTNLIVEADGEEAGKEVEEIEDENDATDVTEPTVDADGKEVDGEVEDVEGDLDLEGEGDAEGEEITEAVNASAFVKAGKLGYNDQFLGRKSLSKTLSMDLGLNPKHEFGGGDWLGFDHIALYARGGKKTGTILADALSGKYTYDELKAAAADFLGIKESIVNEAGKEIEEIEDEDNSTVVDTNVTKPENVEKDLDLEGEGDAEGEEIKEAEKVEETEEEDAMESYKNEITEKLQALINKASEKATNDPHFFRFVSESTKNEFNELPTEDKAKVINAVEGKGFLTEGQILGLWNHALITDAPKAGEPNVLKMMPAEYREAWTGLSEAKKNQILAQSKYHVLETAYQVANFWQTRDLRETAPVMEKVSMIKESKEETKALPYDLTDITAQINKRFNK
jgi:hypothetical protein